MRRAMRLLEGYQPCLVAPVLTGTAEPRIPSREVERRLRDRKTKTGPPQRAQVHGR